LKLDVPNMRLVVEDGEALSVASRARADARTFYKESPDSTPSEVFQFLIEKGYGKSTAGRAKEVVF